MSTARLLALHARLDRVVEFAGIRSLPIFSTDGTVRHHQVPFPVAQASVRAAFKNFKKTSHALIPLDQLRASQSTISNRGVRQYLRGGRAASPLVLRTPQGFVIRDGHHRLTASKLRGHKSAWVDIADQPTNFGWIADNPGALTATKRLYRILGKADVDIHPRGLRSQYWKAMRAIVVAKPSQTGHPVSELWHEAGHALGGAKSARFGMPGERSANATALALQKRLKVPLAGRLAYRKVAHKAMATYK